jgi:hypothetical protein
VSTPTAAELVAGLGQPSARVHCGFIALSLDVLEPCEWVSGEYHDPKEAARAHAEHTRARHGEGRPV